MLEEMPHNQRSNGHHQHPAARHEFFRLRQPDGKYHQQQRQEKVRQSERKRRLKYAAQCHQYQQSRDKSFTPFRFTMRDKSCFCFAGIYEKWIRPPEEAIARRWA